MTKIEFPVEVEIDTIVGKSLEVQDKILYPIIQISILRDNNGNIIGMWVIPIAIVVEEDLEKFIFSLTDEHIDFDKILETLHIQ